MLTKASMLPLLLATLSFNAVSKACHCLLRRRLYIAKHLQHVVQVPLYRLYLFMLHAWRFEFRIPNVFIDWVPRLLSRQLHSRQVPRSSFQASPSDDYVLFFDNKICRSLSTILDQLIQLRLNSQKISIVQYNSQVGNLRWCSYLLKQGVLKQTKSSHGLH